MQSPDDVAGVEVRDPTKVAWLSQTTLSVDETMETVDRIREQFPNLLDPPSDDICYATQNRQQAVKEIAAGADLVLVVGSGNSSNSVRLVEVALESGAKAAYRVDDASEIDEAWLDGVETVGVTSGASVPEDLVDGVLDFLAERGYPGREGRAHRRGVADLRAAARAAPRHANCGRPTRLTPTATTDDPRLVASRPGRVSTVSSMWLALRSLWRQWGWSGESALVSRRPGQRDLSAARRRRHGRQHRRARRTRSTRSTTSTASRAR